MVGERDKEGGGESCQRRGRPGGVGRRLKGKKQPPMEREGGEL